MQTAPDAVRVEGYSHTEGQPTDENFLATREFSFVITEEAHEAFKVLSGDYNPIHNKGIVHGAHIIARISAVIGTRFPGPKTVIRQICNAVFDHPVRVGEQVYVHLIPVGRIGRRNAEFEIRAQSDGDKPETVLTANIIVRLPAKLRNNWN